jgi:hypothetical protein
LTKLAVKQRLFLMDHAGKIKLELVREGPSTNEKTGAWTLNGFELQEEDVVDAIRTSPELLSNLTYSNFESSTNIWTTISSWLNFSSPDEKRLNVVEDLGYVLSVSEVVEIAGHLLGAVSYALTSAPSPGDPVRRELAYELVASRHRGNAHSMYLVADICHEAQKIGHRRSVNTIKVSSSLYIYEPLVLGGVRGVAVNVSGDDSRDLPTADVDQGELKNLMSSKGHFVASGTNDFVLDPSLSVSSERAAKIAYSSTDRLVSASNTSLASFFEGQAATLAASREERRRMEALIAKQEEEERKLRIQREEEAAERLQQAQEAEYEKQMQQQALQYEREFGDLQTQGYRY